MTASEARRRAVGPWRFAVVVGSSLVLSTCLGACERPHRLRECAEVVGVLEPHVRRLRSQLATPADAQEAEAGLRAYARRLEALDRDLAGLELRNGTVQAAVKRYSAMAGQAARAARAEARALAARDRGAANKHRSALQAARVEELATRSALTKACR